MRVPFGVSILAGFLALGLVGCTRSAFAQTPDPSLLTSPGPSSLPFPLPPLPVSPPVVIVGAGVLPTSALSFFDRLDEFIERNVFSFGIPALRARIALAQATERIAELQALERNGQLTSDRARSLMVESERLLLVAQHIVARQVEKGSVSADLVLRLTRTELSAADVLEELLGELEVEVELEEPPATPEPPPGEEIAEQEEGEKEEALEEPEDIADLLEDMAERLVDFEDAVLPVTGESQTDGVPPAILRILAEQKIAKAERDIASALAKVEERLAHGKVLIADTELRASAESSLLNARELFAAGNYAEALSVARRTLDVASRLKSGKIAVEPNALLSPRGEEKAERILGGLVQEGFLSAAEQAAARERVRAATERVRSGLGAPPRREGHSGGDGEENRGEETRESEEKDEEDEEDRSGSGSGKN